MTAALPVVSEASRRGPRPIIVDETHRDPASQDSWCRVSSPQHAPVPPLQSQHRTRLETDGMAWQVAEAQARPLLHASRAQNAGPADRVHGNAGLVRPRPGGVHPAHASDSLPRVADANATATAPRSGSALRLASKVPRRRLALPGRRRSTTLIAEAVQSAIEAAQSGFRAGAAGAADALHMVVASDVQGGRDAPQQVPLLAANARTKVAAATRGRRDQENASAFVRGDGRDRPTGAATGHSESSTTAVFVAEPHQCNRRSDARQEQRCHCSGCTARRTQHRRRCKARQTRTCADVPSWCRINEAQPCRRALDQCHCLHGPCTCRSRHTCCRSDGLDCSASLYDSQQACMPSCASEMRHFQPGCCISPAMMCAKCVYCGL